MCRAGGAKGHKGASGPEGLVSFWREVGGFAPALPRHLRCLCGGAAGTPRAGRGAERARGGWCRGGFFRERGHGRLSSFNSPFI